LREKFLELRSPLVRRRMAWLLYLWRQSRNEDII
jgi:hypothetical protein